MNIIDCPHCGAPDQPEHKCEYCTGVPKNKPGTVERTLWTTDPILDSKINHVIVFGATIYMMYFMLHVYLRMF